MEPLATQFTHKGFRYCQVERHADLAIFTQEHLASGTKRFEFIRIRVSATHTWPNGKTTPEHETYPGANAWGVYGWTFYTLADAQHALTRRQDDV